MILTANWRHETSCVSFRRQDVLKGRSFAVVGLRRRIAQRENVGLIIVDQLCQLHGHILLGFGWFDRVERHRDLNLLPFNAGF
ncbi:hypothetical protein FQZ97_1183020 [compost metagenome]